MVPESASAESVLSVDEFLLRYGEPAAAAAAGWRHRRPSPPGIYQNNNLAISQRGYLPEFKTLQF